MIQQPRLHPQDGVLFGFDPISDRLADRHLAFVLVLVSVLNQIESDCPLLDTVVTLRLDTGAPLGIVAVDPLDLLAFVLRVPGLNPVRMADLEELVGMIYLLVQREAVLADERMEIAAFEGIVLAGADHPGKTGPVPRGVLCSAVALIIDTFTHPLPPRPVAVRPHPPSSSPLDLLKQHLKVDIVVE